MSYDDSTRHHRCSSLRPQPQHKPDLSDNNATHRSHLRRRSYTCHFLSHCDPCRSSTANRCHPRYTSENSTQMLWCNGSDRPPVQSCDECGGDYFTASSHMWKLCSECAHYLYGYPLCEHAFVDQKCSKCGWSGTRSAYITHIIKLSENAREQEPGA